MKTNTPFLKSLVCLTRNVRVGAVLAGSLAMLATVNAFGADTNFFTAKRLPPTNGMYVSPQQWHQAYLNGIIISNIAHRIFTSGVQPPPPGSPRTHNFSSTVELEISTDGGSSWQPAVVSNAPVSVVISYLSDDGSGVTNYSTTMTNLVLSGGGLPANVRIRESTAVPSSGMTTIRPWPGGYMIDSFFDIYTEVSTDGGGTWMPATNVAHVELKLDPALIKPTTAPTKLLPMPNGEYISPSLWHQYYANGIFIKDIRHKLFTDWMEPPSFGQTNTHTFDSQVDFQISYDGGASYVTNRAPATMTVRISNEREFMGRVTYAAEVTQLDIAGGELPALVHIRESPTFESKGGTSMLLGGGGGGGGGGAAVSSFFDIFTEVSTDGGSSWFPAATAPAHVELKRIATVHTFTTNLLPPSAGMYIGPNQWHQYYAMGIVISNVVHRLFTGSVMPPPAGQTVVHTFGSLVDLKLSTDGGQTFVPATGNATVAVQITSRLGGDGVTEYYDTEMQQLDISGGSLPTGVFIHESPSKASLGRTTSSTGTGGYDIDSFFDIYTEVSTDGGANWHEAQSGPAEVTLTVAPQEPVIMSIQRISVDTVQVLWNGSGMLQVATDLKSGFTDLPGIYSPYSTTISGKAQFFRVKIP
jgi:hypothetical protein